MGAAITSDVTKSLIVGYRYPGQFISRNVETYDTIYHNKFKLSRMTKFMVLKDLYVQLKSAIKLKYIIFIDKHVTTFFLAPLDPLINKKAKHNLLHKRS